MTILAEDAKGTEGGKDAAEVVDVPKEPRRRPPSIRRIVAWAGIGVVVLLVAAFLVEDPLSHVWFTQRQHHLGDQYATPGPPQTGSALAILQVPAIGMNLVVVQGDSPGVLRAGPGHQPSSVLPGSLGNSVIFGHRKGWGQPFKALAGLSVGDDVFVQRRIVHTPQAPVFFRVASVARVSTTSRRYFAPSTDHRLTLVTAGPNGGRLIVVAVSGTVGHLMAPDARTSARTGAVGPDATIPLIWTLVGLGLGVVAVVFGRRNHSGKSVAVVSTPLFAAGLLALVLLGDTVFRSSIG